MENGQELAVENSAADPALLTLRHRSLRPPMSSPRLQERHACLTTAGEVHPYLSAPRNQSSNRRGENSKSATSYTKRASSSLTHTCCDTKFACSNPNCGHSSLKRPGTSPNRTGYDSKFADSNPKCANSSPSCAGSDPNTRRASLDHIGCDTKFACSNPNRAGSSLKCGSSNPRRGNSETNFREAYTRIARLEPRNPPRGAPGPRPTSSATSPSLPEGRRSAPRWPPAPEARGRRTSSAH